MSDEQTDTPSEDTAETVEVVVMGDEAAVEAAVEELERRGARTLGIVPVEGRGRVTRMAMSVSMFNLVLELERLAGERRENGEEPVGILNALDPALREDLTLTAPQVEYPSLDLKDDPTLVEGTGGLKRVYPANAIWTGKKRRGRR